MTVEEFKQAFSGECRPMIICHDIQEQADAYEFLMRIGYELGSWERSFLKHDGKWREVDRQSYQHPIRSFVYGDKVCTSNKKPTGDDIWFCEIEDLIRGDKTTELPELDKLFGGI